MKLCKDCAHMDLSSVKDHAHGEETYWDGAVCNHPDITQVHPVSGKVRRTYCIAARVGKCGYAALFFTARETSDKETANAQ